VLKGIARAHNIYGYGDWSSVNANGDLIFTRPTTISTPRIGSATTATVLEVEWDEITTASAYGGFPILSYSLEQWDGT